jgi:hypothetical protein
MSSTRNKNTPGNYSLEQLSNNAGSKYSTFENSAYGKPVETHLPGDGLLPGRIAPTNLAYNACDIESQLFGIGSTNLVSPARPVNPDFKTVQSLNMIDKLPVLVPEPLVIDRNQRPYFMN